jgi:thiamine kinase-like enzyme
MIVGIDLDNTIIKYDNAFLEAAKFLNLNIPEEIESKTDLKNYCIALNEGELVWQKIQGLAYGKFLLKNAKLYIGVKRFIWRLKNKGHIIKIISHKTKFGHYDDEKYLLREVATEFLKKNNIINCDSPLVNDLIFLNTRKEKIEKILSENVEIFIDDLKEVIFDLKNYKQIKTIHFNEGYIGFDKEEVKSDWQQIDNLINGIWDNNEVIKLANLIITDKIISVNKISQGRNSAVYKLGLENNTFLKFKIYPVDEKHDRINSEFYSTKILNDFGFDSIPKPLNYNKELGIASYQWIDGDAINKHNLDDITNCSHFINDLHKIRFEKSFSIIGLASAACISGKQIEDQLNQRINYFKNVNNKDLLEFLSNEFIPLMNYFLLNAKKKWNFNYSFDEKLPFEKLTLSPSDFGFHNIIKNNNNLCFIDFEYFGFDDPVKLISDFYYHPGMNLSVIQKKHWLSQTFKIFDEEVYIRANLCKPLYGLIWCLIILNDFRPEILGRRISATTDDNLIVSSILEKQLGKAKSLLELIKFEEIIN